MNRCSLCQQPKDDSDFAALVVEYHGNEPEPDATSLCQECRALHRLMQRERTAKLLQTAVVQSMDRASLGARQIVRDCFGVWGRRTLPAMDARHAVGAVRGVYESEPREHGVAARALPSIPTGFLRGIFATLLLNSERGEPLEKSPLPMLATQNTEPTTHC